MSILKRIFKAVLFMFLLLSVSLAVFWLYQNRAPVYRRLGEEEKASLVARLNLGGLPPEDYVGMAVKRHQIVLIGEPHRGSEHYLFIAHSLAKARAAGASFLAMELFHVSTQKDIDILLNGKTFDEALGRRIVLRAFPGFYYEELLEILRSAWQVRRNARAFDVVALGGGTDRDMARLVAAAAKDGRKGLMFCGMHHAYVRYDQPGLSQVLGLSRRSNASRTGTLLAKGYDLDAVFIQLHAAFPKKYFLFVPVFLYRKPFVLPFDGVLDQVFAAYGKPVGFDSSLDGFSGLLETNSYYASGYPELKLSDYCDGYIYLNPLSASVDVRILSGMGARPGELEAIWAGVDAYAFRNAERRQRLRALSATPAMAEAWVRHSGLTPAGIFGMTDMRGIDDLYLGRSGGEPSKTGSR